MKYFLTSLGVVLLIIFGIVVFGRSSTTTTPGVSGHKTLQLSDYQANNNAYVAYEIAGPINAVENHVSLKITVSPNSRTINVYQGYQNAVLTSQTLGNDSAAYSQFLAALNKAGFTNERTIAKGTNATSICPTGTRSNFSLVDGSKDVMNLWTASCTLGSYGGNVNMTTHLFEAQIPDYSTLVSSVSSSTTNTSVLH